MVLAPRAVAEVCSLRWALLEEEDGGALVPSLARARAARVDAYALVLDELGKDEALP
jgi:hypothetical protein